MNATGTILLVVALGLMDLMIVGGVLYAAARMWKQVESAWPPQPITSPSYGKRWQSLSMGVFNFGLMWNMIADEGHIHLTPHGPFSRLVRLTKVSIPRAAVNEFTARHAPRPDGTYRYVEVRTGHTTVRLPGWVAGQMRPPA